MLKKRFYDILTIIFILLLIFGFYIQIKNNSRSQDLIFECFSEGHSIEDLENCVEEEHSPSFLDYSGLIIYFLIGVYWLFILVLSIQLHKKDLTKIVDVVVIALISPLAFIFYLTNLRKSLKKYELSNVG